MELTPVNRRCCVSAETHEQNFQALLVAFREALDKLPPKERANMVEIGIGLTMWGSAAITLLKQQA